MTSVEIPGATRASAAAPPDLAAHRRWFALLVLVYLAAYAPPLLRGRVAYPHGNVAEVGLDVAPLTLETRVFVDQCTLYVPELALHHRGPHASWVATWNPHNSLGRPVLPSGLGNAFPPAWLLARFTTDPWTLYTWLGVLSVVATGTFAFLFLALRGLRPSACWAGAVGISLGPIYAGWQAIPLVQWGFAWAFAALLAVELWLRRPSVGPWLLLVAAVHAILISGFPQHVHLLGLIAASWVVVRVLAARARASARLLAPALLASAVVVGVATVMPAWLDLLVDWRLSARANFETRNVALAEIPGMALQFAVHLVTVPLHGESGWRSMGLTPVFAAFVAVGVVRARSAESLLLVVWSLVIVLGMVVRPADALWRALGLTYSEWPPIYAAQLPLAVLAARGVHQLVSRAPGERRTDVVAAALPLAVAGLLLPFSGVRVEPAFVAAEAAMAAGVVLVAWWPRPLALVAVVVFAAFHDSAQHVQWRPRPMVADDSPLAREVRGLTADGSRFAWVGPRPQGDRFLLPNQEITLGLHSIHGYDHLLGAAFQRFAGGLAPLAYGYQAYERRFSEIDGAASLDERFLARCGVSVLLSLRPLEHPRVVPHRVLGPVHVSRVRDPGPLAALVPGAAFERTAAGEARTSSAALRAAAPVELLATDGHDRRRFAFAPPAAPALLFVSQQHHPDWHASAAGRPLETVVTDGLFQGVLVPAGTDTVELAFERRIGWIALPQALGLAAALALVLRALLQRVRARSPRVGRATAREPLST